MFLLQSFLHIHLFILLPRPSGNSQSQQKLSRSQVKAKKTTFENNFSSSEGGKKYLK